VFQGGGLCRGFGADGGLHLVKGGDVLAVGLLFGELL